MMNVRNSYDPFSLHRAAAAGEDDTVRYALRSGADVNALDASGRTALMCAIAGNNWRNVDPNDPLFMTPQRVACIRLILNHPKISLLSLNAPHVSMNGVVPLGMAAWLNMPRVVSLLLEESAGTVSVDAMDSHGATALMYAARDGNTEVVQILLSHGARPDFRDNNCRTSVQFSLAHPSTLWLCEAVLRRHRWRESTSADRHYSSLPEHLLRLSGDALPSSALEPPPVSIFNAETLSRLLATLVSSIRSGDLDFLHSLLFSPAVPSSSPTALYPMSVPLLINYPDAQGWSLIHHAMSVQHPSTEIFDSLYLAGADMALFTTHEQWTPLHILAQNTQITADTQEEAMALYRMVIHLVRDLRTPLSASDKDGETCLHIAAERGHSVELLTCLLNCDRTGSVREIKNARGFTAMQVAKSEFLGAFGPNTGLLHLVNSGRSALASSDSISSLATLSNSTDSLSPFSQPLPGSPTDVDIALISQVMISNLRISSPDARHANDPSHLRQLESTLADCRRNQQVLVQYFRDRITVAENEVRDLQKATQRIDLLRGAVADSACVKLSMYGLQAALPRLNPRDSQDSQSTAVSVPRHDFGVHTFMQSASLPGSPVRSSPKLDDGTLKGRAGLATISRKYSGNLLGGSEYEKRHRAPERRVSTGELRQSKADLPKKKGAERFKAWLKKIVVPLQHELQTASPHATPRAAAFAELPRVVPTAQFSDARSENPPLDADIETALVSSLVVLEAVDQDLSDVDASLRSAEEFIQLANHSITKVEKAMKRAFKKRQQMIDRLRASKTGTQWQDGNIIGGSPRLLGLPNNNTLHLRPSVGSITSIRSTHSSLASAANATITEQDDEDTRVVRRLLLRKIEAQSSGVSVEVERALAGLRVVKEVVRGVKRRAYL